MGIIFIEDFKTFKVQIFKFSAGLGVVASHARALPAHNLDQKRKDLQCDLDDALDKIKDETNRAEIWKKACEKARRRKNLSLGVWV
jgi:hypothetical protein